MDGRPRKPSRKATHVEISRLQYSKAFPNDGHTAFAEVFEWFWRLPIDETHMNVFARVVTLLHRDLGNTRQRFAVLLLERSVTDDEYLGVVSNRKILLYAHSSCSICFRAEPRARRRWCYTRSPYRRLAGDLLSSDNNTLCVNPLNTVSEAHFNT